MAPDQRTESSAAAQRRLTEQMLRLGQRIDQAKPGPERLEMLRQEASISDKLEALRSLRR
jgi:hypothetical protein